MMQLKTNPHYPLPFLLPEYRHLPPIRRIVTSSNLKKKKVAFNGSFGLVPVLTWTLCGRPISGMLRGVR